MDDAISLLEELMEKHGLFREGWSYSIEPATKGKFLGLCVHGRRLIVLEPRLFAYHVSQVKDTILHEIAHALVGDGHGHDAVWKRKAREIGAIPRACAQITTPSVIHLPYEPR